MIAVKRAYEPAQRSDGERFLVDHLWPRGVKKEALRATWIKAVSPSTELREWFGHDPAKWEQFQRRYSSELDSKPESWRPLLSAARDGDITLVFSARDTEHNNAVLLRSFLQRKLGGKKALKAPAQKAAAARPARKPALARAR